MEEAATETHAAKAAEQKIAAAKAAERNSNAAPKAPDWGGLGPSYIRL